MSLCPCGSQLEDKDCCLPVLEGAKKAPTAEALMRARYTAHVLKKYDFWWKAPIRNFVMMSAPVKLKNGLP